MAQPPSIKATGFQSAADDLIRLIDAGRISRGEVEARLRAEDLRYLHKQLAATTWVPIDVYARVVEILVEVEANGPVELYLHGRGVRAAQRLHKAGLYRQFEASSETWGNRVGKIATTMAAVLYNFTRWSVEDAANPAGFQINVDDAKDFADECRYTAQGFVKYAATLMADGAPVKISSTRPTPDRIVYTIRRS